MQLRALQGRDRLGTTVAFPGYAQLACRSDADRAALGAQTGPSRAETMLKAERLWISTHSLVSRLAVVSVWVSVREASMQHLVECAVVDTRLLLRAKGTSSAQDRRSGVATSQTAFEGTQRITPCVASRALFDIMSSS